MNEEELLQRIAKTLRQEIGPAVEAEYPRTQAFMAAVVLQKLGRQIGLARTHAVAESAALDKLLAELAREDLPNAVATALAELEQARDKAALCGLIDALYAARTELGATRFVQLLGRVRVDLRASIDRQIEYAA